MRLVIGLAFAAVALGQRDPCTQLSSCSSCIGQTGCGWCSEAIQYANGTSGAQCAGPSYEAPFTCPGIYSTISCVAGYMCRAGHCVETAPGEGLPKDVCEASCTAGPVVPAAPVAPVYVCNATDSTCVQAQAGTHGATSKDVCESSCGKAPSPSTDAPQPVADVYLCNPTNKTCEQVPPGTHGSTSKELCEQQCPNQAGGYSCNRTSFQCVQDGGSSTKEECAATCAPETSDPCERHYTCEDCLKASSECGWCATNVTYKDGKLGTQCAGVGSGIPSFSCPAQYSTSHCMVSPNCSALTDIMFAMDGSGSIRPQEWQLEKKFVGDVAQAFQFGDKASGSSGEFARMGFVQFSSSSHMYQALTGERSVFLRNLAGMQQHPGTTHTADALEQVQEEFRRTMRPETKYRAALVVTDGLPNPYSTQGPGAVRISRELQAQGIDVFAVFVCSLNNQECSKGKLFMDQIASSPATRYSTSVSSWNDVEKLIQSILDGICQH
eukprot:TRINITY_DN12564_c0_g1_i1.p1 TRINITY_DN12564_c0_g1~~TRINITY_DN12564_c0_g1_i1.p1  ORF type:complete len:495 (+),score=106.28 TRINITY_DN12564_c0_g1_i1:74-1558(+)